MNLSEDMKATLQMLGKSNFQEGTWDKEYYKLAYLKTNERIDAYFSKFPLKDSSVLTVEASGDHLLQAVLLGAKDITTFDKNRIAYYVSALKRSAIMALDRDIFLQYFGEVDRKKIFQEEVYQQIRIYLEEDTRMFWDTMYRIGMFQQNYFRLFLPGKNILKDQEESYLSSSNYAIVKEKLQKVNYRFIDSDLLCLPMTLTKENQYHAMFFSNIFDWLYPLHGWKYCRFITDEMAAFLTDNGMCAAYYAFFKEPTGFGKNFSFSLSVPKEIGIGSEQAKVYIYQKK